MNLLEFPNEILFEFCKNMDFQTRVSFRKVCKRTNALLNNPKYFVSQEKMKEWFDKMKMLIGMTLLDHISDHLILNSPSGKFGHIRLSIDESCDFFMTISYHALPFFRNFVITNGHNVFQDTDVIMLDDEIFSKYKLEKHKNIFDHKESIGTFLYDLYISFVCFDQKKNKEKISRNHLSSQIKMILNRPSKFHSILSQIFKSSSYFLFPDRQIAMDTEEPLSQQPLPSDSGSFSFFQSNILNISLELQKDLSRYFIDGEEAEQFLVSYV